MLLTFGLSTAEVDIFVFGLLDEQMPASLLLSDTHGCTLHSWLR